MPKFPVRLLVFEWSGQDYQCILTPWTDISNIEVLQNLSTELRLTQSRDAPPTTALGKAIQTGVRYFNQQPSCWKRTLDISGDGKSNTGPPPHTVNLPEKIGDVVINALVIGIDATTRLSHEELSMDELATYFSNRVLVMPGAAKTEKPRALCRHQKLPKVTPQCTQNVSKKRPWGYMVCPGS